MTGSTQKYTLLDEDGDELDVRYITRSCRCSSGNCYEDTLELHEDGDHPYRLNIPSGELSWLIKGLLGGDYTVKK